MNRWPLALALAALLGCPTEEPEPPLPDPDPEPGPDLTEVLGPDEARAGVLDEGDAGAFIGGAAAESRPGDLLLYNDRARFVIRGMREGHFYIAQPGSLIDADVVRPEGQADRDGLDDLFTMVGMPHIFSADSVEVISDGGDGGPAVVRCTGTDVPFAFLEGLLESPGLFPVLGVPIVQTYTLQPGVPVLEIATEVTNDTGEDLSVGILDAGMIDLALWAGFIPGAGFDGEAPEGPRPMMAMVSHRSDLALAMFHPEIDLEPGGMAALGDEFDLVVMESETLDLAPDESGVAHRLVGVAADLATLEGYRRVLRGLPTGTVEGTLLESGGDAPIAGARVFLTDTDGNPWTVAVTDGEGRFRLSAAPGDYSLVAVGDGNNERMDFPDAWGPYGIYAHESSNAVASLAFTDPDAAVAAPQADGRGRSEPIPVTLAAEETTTADLRLDAPATLSLTVRDGAGEDLPAVVHIAFADDFADPQPRDRRLGESRPRGGARKAVWVLDGSMDVPIPAGRYDVTAHHGPRFEMDTVTGVELASGETTAVSLVLDEAYTTPGYTSGDLHTHASPSIDGELTLEERLATVVVGDVQVHVSTDHDHIADYRPTAEAMGLGEWMISVPGDEISPELRGHHNIYPATPDPSLPNGGAPRWWEVQLTTSELHAFFREGQADDLLLQINHGLDTGMFEASNYDPTDGTPGDADFYSSDFDTMEILNSGDFDEAEQLRDILCAHLDQGLRRVGTGVSDSHGRLSGSGYGRTYVETRAATFDDLAVEDFFSNLAAGRAIITSGPFATLEAEYEGDVAAIGDTLIAPQATLRMEVLAPSWMTIEEVRLFGPGCELLETYAVDPETVQAPLWFEDETVVYPVEDSYYMLEVHGWGDMGPMWSGGRPYALTNPVYVEAP